eukprot:6190309-Pleurochrysis_carterae.AAC.1
MPLTAPNGRQKVSKCPEFVPARAATSLFYILDTRVAKTSNLPIVPNGNTFFVAFLLLNRERFFAKTLTF